jgi:hypothetical protein
MLDAVRQVESTGNKLLFNFMPRETSKTLAGFPKDRGNFYICWVIFEPPESLKEQIFP